MARSYGSSASLCLVKEDEYGITPFNNFRKVSFISSDIGAEQGLISSELLGNGREPSAPFRDVIKSSGSLVVPVDVRDFGYFLQFLLGEASTKGTPATGSITFKENLTVSDTVTINEVEWGFVSDDAKALSTPTSAGTVNSVTSASSESGTKKNCSKIGNSLGATLTNLVKDLNASQEASIKCAIYSTVEASELKITHRSSGTSGNSFKLESRSLKCLVSGGNLSGGGYTHTFVSGAPALASFSLEIGHKNVPAYFMYTGCMLNSMELSFKRSGQAVSTLNILAQGEELKKATQSVGELSSNIFKPFNQFNGQILRNGELLANVTGCSFSYSNGMEVVETIRSDGLIDGIDPSGIEVKGTIDARFADTMLLEDAINGTQVEIEASYKLFGEQGNNFSLTWTFHEVYLPRPKIPISGPGGIQATFNWQAAISGSLAKSVTVTLKNDIESYE